MKKATLILATIVLSLLTIVIYLLFTFIHETWSNNTNDTNQTIIDNKEQDETNNSKNLNSLSNKKIFIDNMGSVSILENWEVTQFQDPENCKILLDLKINCVKITKPYTEISPKINIKILHEKVDFGGGILNSEIARSLTQLKIGEFLVFRNGLIEYKNPEFVEYIIPLKVADSATETFTNWGELKDYSINISYEFTGNLDEINAYLKETDILKEMDFMVESIIFYSN